MELMSNKSEYEKEYGDDDNALLRLARMFGGRGVAKREPAVEKKKSRMGENALHQTTWRHASFITNWLFSYLSSHVFQFFSSPWLLPLEGKSQTSLFTVQS